MNWESLLRQECYVWVLLVPNSAFPEYAGNLEEKEEEKKKANKRNEKKREMAQAFKVSLMKKKIYKQFGL